jgi:hypothetical protein
MVFAWQFTARLGFLMGLTPFGTLGDKQIHNAALLTCWRDTQAAPYTYPKNTHHDRRHFFP